MDYSKLSEQQWRKKLTPEQFEVCRNKGTQPPHVGKYTNCKTAGIYRCVCCGSKLFASQHKFASASGWPSFYLAYADNNIILHPDDTSPSIMEASCATCASHLGHLFPDGPAPTGMRYCINSLSLTLDEE